METMMATPDLSTKEQDHRRLFQELHRRIKEAGLLKARSTSFYKDSAVVFLLLVISLGFTIFFVSGILSAVIAGLFGGLVWGQIGTLGHDAGHGQAPTGRRKSYAAQLLLGNCLLGFSSAWWVKKHTSHHRAPNQMGQDPDIEFPFLAFSVEQAWEKEGRINQFIVRNAWWFFWFLLPFQALNARISSIRFLIEGRAKDPLLQAVGIAVHFVLYGLLLLFLWLSVGWVEALVFFLVHQTTHGVYNSLIFAPNHKGEKMYLQNEHPTFLELQILTSRNVKEGFFVPEWFVTWVYGGLNYQVEHHLFPAMSRSNLKKAQPIVEDFCREFGFSYTVTSIPRAYYEVVRNFKEVSEDLIASPMG